MGWFSDNVLEKAADKAFAHFDKDGDGGLSIEEVKQFCSLFSKYSMGLIP